VAILFTHPILRISGLALVLVALLCSVTELALTTFVPNAEELHQLLVDAGFQAVQVPSQLMTIQLPALEAFVFIW
jgi:hypothetical protein